MIDKMLSDDADVDHWSTYVGRGTVRFYLPLDLQLPNDFFAQAVVVTKGLAERDRVKAKLEQALAKSFVSLGLTDDQERELSDTISNFSEQMTQILESSVEAQEPLQQISKELNQLVELGE